MSALSWEQSICLGVGQNVSPLESKSISSSVSWTPERFVTVEASKRMGVYFLE